MLKFTKNREEELRISVNEGINYFEGNAIIEVYFTQELNTEEKKMIADELSCFMEDKPFMQPNGKLFQIPATVFFHKLAASDVLEI